MSQVAANADIYASKRLNKFFKTTVPDLEGQCVTLTKCFMDDMSDVPSPHAARGDAKNVGNTLVKQGYAVEVPFSKRKRGDLICYEYGTYGHIAVQLSGGRVFEENVNMGGVSSKIVDGSRVYASRIGSEKEAWRSGKNPHVYRLKTYKEGGSIVKPTKDEINNAFNLLGVKDTEKTKEKDYSYYLSKDRGVLWANVAKALYAKTRELKAELAKKPVTINKSAVVEYINKNTK